MGANDPISVVGMLHAFFGTYLISAGAFILNMYMEREFDLRMKRTRNRPLPAGRLAPASAFAFGMLVSFGGIIYLLAFTNIMAAAAGAVGLGSYVFIYTPMKRISHLNTLIGSFPGAIPPIIGWAAATGQISFHAFVLFSILFLWQLPHFLAIAWMYRDDYAAAGMPMLSVIDHECSITVRQTLLYGFCYVVVSLVPTMIGMAGMVYFTVAAISGLIFLGLCLRWFFKRDRPAAVHVFLASLFHIPVLYVIMVLDKVPM
jgi:protoheme IX farnesyltransferase